MEAIPDDIDVGRIADPRILGQAHGRIMKILKDDTTTGWTRHNANRVHDFPGAFAAPPEGGHLCTTHVDAANHETLGIEQKDGAIITHRDIAYHTEGNRKCVVRNGPQKRGRCAGAD
jgi:hypothetical protein